MGEVIGRDKMEDRFADTLASRFKAESLHWKSTAWSMAK
jgi:hypothetical protein